MWHVDAEQGYRRAFVRQALDGVRRCEVGDQAYRNIVQRGNRENSHASHLEFSPEGVRRARE